MGEPEKLDRLRLALDDVPRDLFDKLTPAETATVEIALKSLKEKLDSPQRKELAKRNLALCKQRDDEPVGTFLRRLSPLVEVAHSNLDANQLKERLCEELLDRLRPDLAFLIRLAGLSRGKDLEAKRQPELEGAKSNGRPQMEPTAVTLDVNEFLRALSSMNIQNAKAGNEAASMNAISTVSEMLEPEPMEVSSDECWQMIRHRKCKLGPLIEDSGLWHTDVRIDNSPRHWLLGSWNWKTVASENCYLIPMNVSSKFGDTSIHKEDTVMLITPDEEWKQTGKEIRHFLIGDWESVWWKIISVLVIISTAELLLRFYFLVKDTGSSVTVASRSLAEWLKCAIAPSKEDAISASGHTISFRGKSEFCLEIAAERVSATVYFVDEPKFSPSRDYQAHSLEVNTTSTRQQKNPSPHLRDGCRTNTGTN
uniref:CARD domain-containing protein n=1 Tax=Globodera pallida TaxID=36090 RepID=A0A183CLR7_GLOPA